MEKKKKPLREIIYNKLVDDIVRGRINTGEKLVESELSERFKVSRTPVREVLLQLEKGGYIDLKKNVGAVVKKISIKRVKEIFSLIAVLEGYAAEIVVAGKIAEPDISSLSSLQEDMEDLIRKRDFFAYVSKNVEFHKFFVEKCENETLRKMVLDLRQRIYKLVREGKTLPVYSNTYETAHRMIIKAVSAGNAAEANHLMRMHVTDVMRFSIEMMRRTDEYLI